MDNTTAYIVIGAILGVLLGMYKLKMRKSYKNEPERPFPGLWRQILNDRVQFYAQLSSTDKKEFERKVHIFLLNVPIRGMETEVTHEDKILVAAGAVIPIFRLSQWHYSNLQEIQLFPDSFLIPNTNQKANGLVGWGAMDGKMMLSRKALHLGFDVSTDNLNVAIHEFIHILDKQDGKIDGVLGKIMEDVDITPWLQIVEAKMKEIDGGTSDIRKYGATNQGEFLAVVSEYYFENPDKMRSEHPALYNALHSFYHEKPKRTVFSLRSRKQEGSYNKDY